MDSPSLKGHEHATKLLPTHLPPIDDQHRHIIGGFWVASELASDGRSRNGQTQIAFDQVGRGKIMPHPFEQARHEIKRIGVCGAMHLEFVAFPSSAFDFDSLKRQHHAKEPQHKMEPMPGPVRIEQFHWQEGDMGEGQPVPAGDLLVQRLQRSR
ncbi:hypothetical protein [Sphingobium sp. 15-1]|uniref:hypothetical protein n=1 Tax=Sphingobium sp. 15-1 TaxID=2729616 RepID=UPI001C3F66D0|nr:hypothetical protein [Sphingobium sp. 15-1]